MLITEEELVRRMNKYKRVFLLEPCTDGRRHPLALMKISSYLKDRNCEVKFGYEFFPDDYDAVFVTTLFTYDSREVQNKIKSINKFFRTKDIIVGGVYSTLRPDHFEKHLVFSGYSKTLDQIKPDYSFNFIKTYGMYEHDKFSYINATRGCPNNCEYCYVNQIECKSWVNPNFQNGIIADRPFVNIMDNNLVAFPKQFKRVAYTLFELDKRVHLEGGVDCKRATDDVVKTLSSMKWVTHGLRTAFDRIEEDGVFQSFIKRLLDSGVPSTKILVYCLINHTDTPKEADYRLRECRNLKIETYRTVFTPLDSLDKIDDKYVGKYWTRNLLECFKHFWIRGTLYKSHDWTFEKYLNSQPAKEKFNLKKKDFKAWEGV